MVAFGIWVNSWLYKRSLEISLKNIYRGRLGIGTSPDPMFLCKEFIVVCLKLIKSILILINLILYPVAQSEINPIDISGNYFCTGNDLSNNTEYTVQITATKD